MTWSWVRLTCAASAVFVAAAAATLVGLGSRPGPDSAVAPPQPPAVGAALLPAAPPGPTAVPARPASTGPASTDPESARPGDGPSGADAGTVPTARADDRTRSDVRRPRADGRQRPRADGKPSAKDKGRGEAGGKKGRG